MPAIMEPSEEETIRDVWQHNVEEEFKAIRSIVREYPIIAMDTEFPGVIHRAFELSYVERCLSSYKLLKSNVDELSIIQLGLTFSDVHGNRPKPISTWQFNFKWDKNKDKHYIPSIELLERAGIEFDRMKTEGIDLKLFGELIMVSGLVLVERATWVSFHSSYDFAYLLKLLTCSPIPNDAGEFYNLMQTYFPNLYDIKYIMFRDNLYKGGLQALADKFKVKRVGRQHQAGSDSRMTGDVFFKLLDGHFANSIEEMGQGVIFGIDPNLSVNE